MNDSMWKSHGTRLAPRPPMRRAQKLLPGLAAAAVAALAAAGCTAGAAQATGLGARLDCLRERKLAVVAAHRGQPDPASPDNALSSLKASLAAGIPFLEVDVATTRDGVLVLMHDDSLDRTTTGSGPVNARSWADVRVLRLRRPDGGVLNERVPRFADVLAWGRKAGAYFEVDVKKTTRWADVVAALRAARMEQRVLIITERLEDARTVHSLAPEVMISVTIEKPEDLVAVRAALPADRLLAWTGTREPGSTLLDAVRAEGIEPILGTLGRPGERLDDVYAVDGEPSEYRDLVRAGIVMIASDRAAAAQRVIGDGYKACLSEQ